MISCMLQVSVKGTWQKIIYQMKLVKHPRVTTKLKMKF